MDEEYLQLAKFPNVYIQSLEENPSMFESFEAKYQKSIEKNKDLLDKQSIENHLIQKGNMDIFADNSDFLLYGNIKDANMHSWWTSQDAYVFFKEKGIKNNHLFWGNNIKNKDWTLLDTAFLEKDKDNKRIGMSWWPKIIGANWQTERDKVHNVLTKSGKKSLIFLGERANEREMDLLISLFLKYGDQYEIFYKGHPGHQQSGDFIENILNKHKDIPYTNVFTNEFKMFKMPKDKQIYVLTAQIPSEELTTNNVKDKEVDEKLIKGLHFDKWAGASMGSTALLGLNNGVNDYKKDFIAGMSYASDKLYEKELLFDIENPESMKPFYEWFESKIK